MSSTCERLHLFIDGELPPADAENFRHHLGRCASCQAVLRELVLLEALTAEALRAPGALRPIGRTRRWRREVGALAAALVALALAFLYASLRPSPRQVWLAQAQPRHLEARVSYPPADVHHPFEPRRGDASPSEPPPLGELARLEARGDLPGIAAAYLARDDVDEAARYLSRANPSPGRDSDLAIVALARGSPDEALTLLDGVLEKEPRSPQALWNRGLVLRDLGLTLLAADAFSQVAALREPGWSDEARERAGQLRREAQAQQGAWTAARQAVLKLLELPDAPLPLIEARSHPGVVRESFYEVVRSAPTRQRVLALRPLAEALDQAYGGTVLRDYLQRVAGRDFERRGPLARAYARLVREGLPVGEPLLEQLRSSGEGDLLLGAALRAPVPLRRRYHRELVDLARAGRDPWFDLLAEAELAREETAAGHWWKAEQRLFSTLQRCREQTPTYRCFELELRLGVLYLNLNRLVEADQHVRTGWAAARHADEWSSGSLSLQELSHIARFRYNLASARAYIGEWKARFSERSCTWPHENLAEVFYRGLKMGEARREMEEVLKCRREQLDLPAAQTLADLARFAPGPGDGSRLHQALGDFLVNNPVPGDRVNALFIEGRFEVEQDRPKGETLLRRAIQEAEQLPSDVTAREAWALSYASLAFAAGKAGEYDRALAVVATQLGLPSVERCALAVVVERERTLLVSRDASGRTHGIFETGRRVPFEHADASSLVPAWMLDSLRACERVDVLAWPPVLGRTDLLPATLAWSYRVGTGDGAPSSRSGVTPRHLVVANVETPSFLQLPRLPAWASPRGPDEAPVELTGPAATPSEVLARMATATEIEIHAHGVIDPSLSDASIVVLSPEEDGRYALTADEVRKHRLAAAPLVLLVSCSAAKGAPFIHQPFSLPAAFIEAGARAVLASTVDIPDGAARFFDHVRMQIRSGVSPSRALRDERLAWLKADPAADWVAHVMLFERS